MVKQETNNRLAELYNRSLVRSEIAPKTLPWDHILNKNIEVFPLRDANTSYDIVEIGPGTGDFLFFLAEQYPQKNILGIEMGQKRFCRIKERILKRELSNITLACADARQFFYKELIDTSIEKCFLLFPDPWPKNKHRHLRLAQADFLTLIAKRLKPDGEFTLATDVKDYATWVWDNLSKIPHMQNCLDPQTIVSELPDIPATFFKKKWEKLGRQFYYLRFKKSL